VVARPRIRILSLCSGIGGLDLGVHRALTGLGFSPVTVCYVEGEAFAASVLVKQMEKGALDAAPIWSDLKTFDASRWRGSVDAVVAGFPCQPFSLAGKGLAKDDPRHLWPHVLRVLKESGATMAFLENVPGLVRRGLRDVIEDLSGAGFNAGWGCHAASEAGAIHKRERLFILAHADGEGESQQEGALKEVGRRPGRRPQEDDAYSHHTGCQEQRGGESGGEFLAPSQLSIGRPTQPGILRGVHGVPNRLDRIRTLGNAVVPQCAERAFRELWQRAVKPQRRRKDRA